MKTSGNVLMRRILAILLPGLGLATFVFAGQAGAKPPAAAAGDPASREAQAAFARGDWQTAIQEYEKLVKTAPRISDYHLNLGIALYSAGRPYDAVAPLRQALKLNPTLAPAKDSLGMSLAETGHCGEALPLLKKAVTRAADKDARRTIELDTVRCAMAVNRMDEAIDSLRLLTRGYPNDPEVLYLAVHVFSDLSIRASQALLFTAPGSYQVHELNAEALETQGDWKDAAAEYREVLKKEPNLAGIHYRLGRLLLSAPKTATSRKEAQREFEAELKIDPNNAGAEYVLGELAREDEQWPAAIEHFGRAAKLDAGFADAFIGLGRSLIAANRAAEAVAPLETAEKLQPDNPVPHFHLATAYRRTGRKEDANREFALHQQASERARQTQQNVQAGVAGPQEVLGPQKAEP
jgi:tetratricopeptide (TPR) repeat protein